MSRFRFFVGLVKGLGQFLFRYFLIWSIERAFVNVDVLNTQGPHVMTVIWYSKVLNYLGFSLFLPHKTFGINEACLHLNLYIFWLEAHLIENLYCLCNILAKSQESDIPLVFSVIWCLLLCFSLAGLRDIH